MAGPPTTRKRTARRAVRNVPARLPAGFSDTLLPAHVNRDVVVLGERVHAALYRQNEGAPPQRLDEVARLAHLAVRWARFRLTARQLDRGPARSRLHDLLDDGDQPPPLPPRHEDRRKAYRHGHPGADRGRGRPWWRQLPGALR